MHGRAVCRVPCAVCLWCYDNVPPRALRATCGDRYADAADTIFKSAPRNPAEDLPTQLAKLGAGLLGERYAVPPGDGGEGPAASSDVCVRPLSFKTLVGAGHSEFSTGRQQDAAE
jgi:ubiquitin carboxyl-terminal hydrolase 5/13